MRVRDFGIGLCLGLAACTAPVGQETQDVAGAMAPPTVEVSLASGWRLEANVRFATSGAYRVRSWLSVREGDRVLRADHVEDKVVDGEVMNRTVYADVTALGRMSDSARALRSMSVMVEAQRCLDEACETTEVLPRVERPFAFLARPFPDAQLHLTGGYTRGPLNALDELEDQLQSCRRVLVAANGTMHESLLGVDAMGHFMTGRNYDCVVGAAYHDRDGGWGPWHADDTRYFCQSAELATDALEEVYAVVADSEVDHWDVFAHSKGAAAAIRLYQRRWFEMRDWPDSRLYNIGLPERMAAEYLPTPADYRPGEIYAEGQLIAFTWTNDGVRHVTNCGDIDALFIDALRHDYSPLLAAEQANEVTEGHRRAFVAGEKRWIGDRYEND